MISSQICSMLNYATPRPGESYRLLVGVPGDEPVAIEAIFPGALDFDRGLVKVDFQLWPLFQAMDLDHILTCVEVRIALKTTLILTGSSVQLWKGRLLLQTPGDAQHRGQFVEVYRRITWVGRNLTAHDPRGRSSSLLALELLKLSQRDMTLVIEDPGPFIIVSLFLGRGI